MSEAGRFPERKQRGHSQFGSFVQKRAFGNDRPPRQLGTKSATVPGVTVGSGHGLGPQAQSFEHLLSEISAIPVSCTGQGGACFRMPVLRNLFHHGLTPQALASPSPSTLQPSRQIRHQVSLYLPPLRVSFATGGHGVSPAQDSTSSPSHAQAGVHALSPVDRPSVFRGTLFVFELSLLAVGAAGARHPVITDRFKLMSEQPVCTPALLKV